MNRTEMCLYGLILQKGYASGLVKEAFNLIGHENSVSVCLEASEQLVSNFKLITGKSVS